MRAAPLAMLVLLAAAARGDATVGSLAISDAWARPTPPGITVGAVYLSIHNGGSSDDRLVGVSSAWASRGEIHETRSRAGSMEMRQVPALACPPGATVNVSPGGVHIMLLGLKQPLMPGALLPLTLTFEAAGSVTLTVPVQARD